MYEWKYKFILSHVFDKFDFDDKMINELSSDCFGMVTPQQIAFCVLRFSHCEWTIIVQRDFRKTYGTEVPTTQSIR